MLKISPNRAFLFFRNMIFAFAAVSSLLLASCRKERSLTAANSLSHSAAASNSVPQGAPSSEKVPARLRKISPETKSYLAGKNIIVILGYGYNDDASIFRLTKSLNENFGVETEEKAGLVSIFVYPSDFMVAGKERISSLVDRLEDKTPAGMVILGAPDGLHIALSKLQDKAETGTLDYPVFTLFSQDDVLGSESTSDFVLDYAHKTNTIDGEVTDFIPDFDADEILTNAISEMIELRGPLKADGNLLPFVQRLLGKRRSVTRYVDGETGLQSINHFIFE